MNKYIVREIINNNGSIQKSTFFFSKDEIEIYIKKHYKKVKYPIAVKKMLFIEKPIKSIFSRKTTYKTKNIGYI